MAQRGLPEINAGSMADIAFLLLIFFLVTTTLNTEIGIFKMLPKKDITNLKVDVSERNVLEINLNSTNEILIEGSQLVLINDIRQVIIDFIDNGGGTDLEGNECSWCLGNKNEQSSDHPAKAIIKIESNRNASYASYIAVQNEILGAYSELRNRLAQSLYGTSFTNMVSDYKKDKNNTELYSKIELIRKKYPQHISEEIAAK